MFIYTEKAYRTRAFMDELMGMFVYGSELADYLVGQKPFPVGVDYLILKGPLTIDNA